MNNKDIAFTHRPLAGVSVGAFNSNNVLYIAAAFTNDGFSRNGNYNKERNDTFSRAIARRIIAGRIMFAQRVTETEPANLPANRFTFEIETDMSGHDFMRTFRQSFKPEIDETDNVLHNSFVQEDVEYRARMSTTDIWNIIGEMAHEVVAMVATDTEATGN